MSQKDDYQRLASQFVDTWHKNMAAAMNDSEFIRVFLQMMQASSFSARENSSYGNSAPPHPTAGPTASPDTGYHTAAGIADRLAALEVRFSALERAVAGRKSPARAKPAKSMARSAKRPSAGRRSGKRGRKKND